MKTFKLYSFSLFERQQDKVVQVPIEITDGLIINMENADKTWYIDAVFSKDKLAYFQQIKEDGRNVLVDVIITSKDNHPAAMITTIRTITELSDGVSVLFKAKLAQKKDDVIENVLRSLIEKGYKENELVATFSNQIRNEGKHSEETLNDLYFTLQQSGQYNLR